MSTIACKADPRDAEIRRLNTREDQLITALTDQIEDLKTSNLALQEIANNERYITHLEGEESQMRETISLIALNSSRLMNDLAGQNQELQNSLVKLTNQQNQINGNLLDRWEGFGGYYPYPANIPCGYWPFDLPTPRRYGRDCSWEEDYKIIGDF